MLLNKEKKTALEGSVSYKKYWGNAVLDLRLEGWTVKILNKWFRLVVREIFSRSLDL